MYELVFQTEPPSKLLAFEEQNQMVLSRFPAGTATATQIDHLGGADAKSGANSENALITAEGEHDSKNHLAMSGQTLPGTIAENEGGNVGGSRVAAVQDMLDSLKTKIDLPVNFKGKP